MPDDKRVLYDNVEQKEDVFKINHHYEIFWIQGRKVKVLVDTNKPNNFKFDFRNDRPVQKFYVQEQQTYLSPSVQFNPTSIHNIVIPKSYNYGNVTISELPTGRLSFPINGFIDPDVRDPFKLFYFSPQGYYMPDSHQNLSTDWYQPPTEEDNENVMLVQEVTGMNFNFKDGFIDIDALNNDQLKSFVGFIFPYRITKGLLENAKDIAEGVAMLKDFGFKGKFYVKTTKGKQYVIFKGHNGLKKWYKGTRYAVTNPKVMKLTLGGAGNMGKSILKSAKVGGFTVLIEGAVDFVEWLMSEDENKEVSDFLVTFGMDVAKAVIGGLITTGVVALALVALPLIFSSIPVVVIVLGTVGLSIGFGWALDYIDDKLGVTAYLQDKTTEGKKLLGDYFNDFFIYPLGSMLYQFNQYIESMYYEQFNYLP